MNTISTQLPFKGVMSSLIGGRRENQDSCGYSETPRGLLLVVCDGMGGGPGGKTASSIATAAIIKHVLQAKPSDSAGSNPYTEQNRALLHEAVTMANQALRDKITESPELSGMGTTVTALLLTPQAAIVAHVGDSRVFQLRKGRIIFRTADHSRVAEMVRAGALSEEQARLSAISNLITRALGIGDTVEVDTQVLSYQNGDRFVLCTDGVWGSMPQPEIVKLFTCNKSLEGTTDIVNMNVENAGRAKGGHHDNYTMIIVECNASSTGRQPEIKRDDPGRSFNPKVIAAVVAGVVVIAVGGFLFFNKLPDVPTVPDKTVVDSVSTMTLNKVDTIKTSPQATAIETTVTTTVETKTAPVAAETVAATAEAVSLQTAITVLTEVNKMIDNIKKKNIPSVQGVKAIKELLNANKELFQKVCTPAEFDMLFREVTANADKETSNGFSGNGVIGALGEKGGNPSVRGLNVCHNYCDKVLQSLQGQLDKVQK